MSELRTMKFFEAVPTSKEGFYQPGAFVDGYLKSEADEVISTIKAERDEYRYNLSCARNEIHNLSISMKEDVKTIVELKADYKEACDRLQTANLIKDEQLAAARHHKYKRCLAMAWWCEATALWCYQAANTLPAGFHATLYGKPVMIEPDRLFNRYVLLTKWSARWREIAEKFKEAK